MPTSQSSVTGGGGGGGGEEGGGDGLSPGGPVTQTPAQHNLQPNSH